jgi:hypothetical protein
VVLQGTGFASKVRVWFGDAEVPAKDVLAFSTKKVQVTVPPGAPGEVTVAVQNGDDASTRRSLEGAFTYDPFYFEPDEAPTSGGTIVTLLGAETTWAPGTTVKIGDKACNDVKVASATELSCTAPPGAAGSRSVTVVNDGEKGKTVLDAFLYADSDNGFKGGLSGDPLPAKAVEGEPVVAGGQLRVIALDNYSGEGLAGAVVFIDDEPTPRAKVDGAGVAVIDGVFAGATVTVAHKCSQPQSFVAVPVSTVTMYLDPVVSPACAPPEGEIPPVGGKPSAGATVQGEVVFPPTLELKDGGWNILPQPIGEGERRVVYLFPTTNDAKGKFQLPPASQAVTETPGKGGGYTFQLDAPVGNLSLYALAGIEDRTSGDPKFTAYAFGLVKGVSTKPGATTADVALAIDTTLDQVVTLSLDPPQPGPRGPDRLQASVAVLLGNAGYAIFPGAQRSQLLPLGDDGEVSFVGLPPLTGSLEGFSYVSTAQAGTGASLSLPVSVVGKFITTSASTKVPIDSFVRVPVLDSPPSGGGWDGSQYAISFPTGGAPADLLLIDVGSGGGLVGWTIAAPGGTTSFRLPDLRQIAGAGLVPGPISVTVSAAKVPDFEYGGLRYKHFSSGAWSAYARDAFFAFLPP